MKRYVAVHERDESGRWLVHVRGLRGCQTYGRTIAQAKERIKEALEVFLNRNIADGELLHRIELPMDIRTLVRVHWTARTKAEHEAQRAQKALRQAAKKLIEAHVSVRDAGDLLGLSHQRVHQVIGRPATRKARRSHA
jgi:predicted RNase H-like HicB family nuclease